MKWILIVARIMAVVVCTNGENKSGLIPENKDVPEIKIDIDISNKQ
jgi:hypothetical protein